MLAHHASTRMPDDPPMPASADGRSKCVVAAASNNSSGGDAGTTLSGGGCAASGNSSGDGEGSGSPAKRARSDEPDTGVAPSPAKPAAFAGLMLSMDYQRAVESINLQLACVGGDSCVTPGQPIDEPPLTASLSPTPGACTPQGPDLLSPELLPSAGPKWELVGGEDGGASAKRKRR